MPGRVILVAAVHYVYMRWSWVPSLRVRDRGITVLLYLVEFNLILNAAQKPTSSKSFWRLFPGTVVMLAFEDAGEASPRGVNSFLFACTEKATSSSRSSRLGRWSFRRVLSGRKGCLQLYASDGERWLGGSPSELLLQAMVRTSRRRQCRHLLGMIP